MGLELQAVGELIFDLQLGPEDIGGGPGVGENGSIFGVRVFGLEVTSDQAGLGVLSSSNTEGHIGGGLGFDFQTKGVEWIVTTKEVVGAFSKILLAQKARHKAQHTG
jgi:hypothetical protein